MPTTVVAAITSTLRLAAMAGDVRLAPGEAGLLQPCVVNLSQIRTIDRTHLGERVGATRRATLRLVLEGLVLLFGTDEVDASDVLA